MKTSVVIGLFVGGPVIFYQLWRFITPGLTRKERRYALPFVLLSQVMFASGSRSPTSSSRRGCASCSGWAVTGSTRSCRRRVPVVLPDDLDRVRAGLRAPARADLPRLVGSVVRRTCCAGPGRTPSSLIVVAAAFITPTTDAVTLFFMAGRWCSSTSCPSWRRG
jgi:hypothetical protein